MGHGTRSLVKALVAVLLSFSCVSFSAALLIASGVGQDSGASTNTYRMDDFARRLLLVETDVKDMRLDVAVTKSDMAEMKWVARGAATGVVAQILMAAFGFSLRRPRRDSDVTE